MSKWGYARCAFDGKPRVPDAASLSPCSWLYSGQGGAPFRWNAFAGKKSSGCGHYCGVGGLQAPSTRSLMFESTPELTLRAWTCRKRVESLCLGGRVGGGVSRGLLRRYRVCRKDHAKTRGRCVPHPPRGKYGTHRSSAKRAWNGLVVHPRQRREHDLASERDRAASNRARVTSAGESPVASSGVSAPHVALRLSS